MAGIICLLVIVPELSEVLAEAQCVSIFANGGMLAPTLSGDEILFAARCFFLWRSKYCSPELGMLNTELGKRKGGSSPDALVLAER